VKSEPRSTPQLSEKEIAERRAAGRCFRCNESGHLARNCPQGSSVKHSGNKPPGRASFNVELGAIGETSDSNLEVLESMPLGAIEFVEVPPVDEDFAWPLSRGACEPDWVDHDVAPCNFIGDCYAMMAKHVLYDCQPYPGDEQYTAYDFNRFTLIPYDKYYQIIDSQVEFQVNVPHSLLERSQFDLGRWYSKRRAKALSLHYLKRPGYYAFGDPISFIGSQLLEDGIESNYPIG